MATDFRAELQRLVQAYDDHGGRWPQHHEQALYEAVEAARTTLAAQEQSADHQAICDELADQERADG
jgi:hypothetical protein